MHSFAVKNVSEKKHKTALSVHFKTNKKKDVLRFLESKLYILVAKDEKSMSVAVTNIFLDDIYDPEIILDREYSEIKFVNCTGRLEGNKVILSDIHPYDFVIFEVK